MILNNIKTRQKDSGFTIVELLVVIVVIGILAAITIVSYSGITARASTKSNAANASSVLSAAMVAYANNGVFPTPSATSATAIANLNGGDAKLPGGITVTNAITVVGAGTTIRYLVNNATVANATGVCVTYWDYTANTFAPMYGGAATTDNNLGTVNGTNCT